jgi:two-component sensor histidine kinase/Tfp pilus assembly protein PilF
MKRKNLLFLLAFVQTIVVFGQHEMHTIDSLKSELLVANDTSKVILLNALAKAYQFNETQQFLNYALKAEQLAQQINYKKGEVLALRNIANYYLTTGDYKTAKLYYEKALVLARKSHSTELYHSLLMDYGSSCLLLGDQKIARKCWDTVLSYATANKNDKLLGKALNKMEKMFASRGTYDSAAFYGIKALEIAEKRKDSIQICNIMTDLGTAELVRKDYEKAMGYFATSLMIANNIKNKALACYNLISIGSVLLEKKENKKAIDYFLKTLTLGKELKDKPLIASAYSSLGSAYYNMGDYDRAYAYYKYALGLARETDDKSSTLYILKNIGFILTSKKKYNEAIGYLEQALKEIKNDGFKVELLSTYSTLAEAYAGLNDFKNAYKYHILYSKVDSIIFNKDRERATAEVTTKYNIEKKAKEILVLKKDNKIKDLQLSNNRLIIIAAIIIFILTSIILLIFYNKFQIKKKANAEKELLLREIHHRVKNNLQIILSILNIQGRKMKDDSMAGFIRESESRIQTMAIIHEKLYQSDNLAQISFKEYISELIDFIYTVYNVDKEKINCTISETDVRLDINMAVPLGLIINELVCNSLKHAFLENESGTILIQLTTTERKTYELIIRDSGKGFPANFDTKKTSTLGLKLIQTLVRQMGGNLTLTNDAGTMALIHFKEAA